jgi:hypothetical protein
MLVLLQEWHHRQTWRIIHELYANSASTPIIEGQTTELYRIEQGVAQGCPMSPTLFNVFIDDLLDDLQTQCHDDGIPISSALDRLVGMAYADDLKTVSGTRGPSEHHHEVKRHSELWRWTANVTKSHTQVSNPVVPAAHNRSMWAWLEGLCGLLCRHKLQVLGVGTLKHVLTS